MRAFREKEKISLSSLCRLVNINRLSYYRSKSKQEQKQTLAQEVVALARSIRKQMPRLGGKKLYHMLYEQLRSLKVGRDKFFDILRANHMLIKPKRRYHITTNSHHRFKKHKNKIEELAIERPEQVWVSDITYVGNRSNPMYLALVTDAYSKKIMGYDLSSSLDTTGAIRALKMAIKARQYPKKDLIHHSDRGLQYCSNAYQELLTKQHITCSMTESYDPYANAVAERVNGILKQEFIGDHAKLPMQTMKQLVKESIQTYNQVRPHWSSFLLTPEQMHLQQAIKMRTYKSKIDHRA